MSTSFQPAEWDDQFFTLNPSAPTTLGNLEPHHIRLQAVSEGVPQGAAGTGLTTWDFATVDAITQPVLGVGDHSPEFQIAKAPPFMYTNNDSSDSFLDLTFQQFAGYMQNLVRYYDTGGFMANGQLYASPAYPADPVTWWGIYNEPNINNNLTPEQYVTLSLIHISCARHKQSIGRVLCSKSARSDGAIPSRPASVPLQSAPSPVSYTHLDVYKRQKPPSCARCGRSQPK